MSELETIQKALNLIDNARKTLFEREKELLAAKKDKPIEITYVGNIAVSDR